MPRCAHVVTLAFWIAGSAAAQSVETQLQRAREVAGSRPTEALRIVDGVIAQGGDSLAVHRLHAELLIAVGDFAAARAARSRALERLESAREELDALLHRIEDAEAAATPSASSSDVVPVDPGNLDAAFRRATELQGSDRPAAAGEQLLAIARAATGPRVEQAKDRVVAVIQQLVADADSTPERNSARARQNRAAAFAQTRALHELGDVDRSFAAIDALANSNDPDVQRPLGDTLADMFVDYVERSNEAHAAGDENASRYWAGLTARPLVKFRGAERDPEQERRILDGFSRIEDPAAKRRAILAIIAWGEELVREGQQALRDHDAEVADRYLERARRIARHLAHDGEHRASGDILRMFDDLDAGNHASSARAERIAQAETLAAAAGREQEAGRTETAARMFAGAFWNDTSRVGLAETAARLYTELGRRIEARRIYQAIERLSTDPEAAGRARQEIAALMQWAIDTFRSNRKEFERLVHEDRLVDAMDQNREALELWDRAKLSTAQDSIKGDRTGTKTILREMARSLADGRIAAREAGGDDAASKDIAGTPARGDSFVASSGIRLRAVALDGQAARESDDDALLITEVPIRKAEITDYRADLGIRGQHGFAQVSLNNAIMFCVYLTRRERDAGRLAPGYCYSLPTAAEWESIRKAEDLDAETPGIRGEAYAWCLDRVARSISGRQHPPVVATRTLDNVVLRVVIAARPDLEPPYEL